MVIFKEGLDITFGHILLEEFSITEPLIGDLGEDFGHDAGLNFGKRVYPKDSPFRKTTLNFFAKNALNQQQEV